jgi:hypothetical protein
VEAERLHHADRDRAHRLLVVDHEDRALAAQRDGLARLLRDLVPLSRGAQRKTTARCWKR